MKICLSIMPLGLLLLTVFAAAQDKAKQAQLEGLNVTMTLRKRTPVPQQADWPAEPITLTARSVAVDGKTIHELLRSNHIFPDVEAFSVVYSLNPQVKSLSNVNVPQVRIPVVEGGAKLQTAFAGGFMIFLTLDKELKDSFSANAKELARLTQVVAALGPEKFQSPAARQEVIASLQGMSTTLNRINDRLVQRFGRPIPTEALSHLNAEVSLLNRTLGGVTSPGALIGKPEQGRIAAVAKDIAIKQRAYTEVAAGAAPERWPEVTVTVKTLKGSSEVGSLRVYYVPEALKGQDGETHSFGVLSSPSNQSLPEADYCFWAARDPDKKSITNEQCVEVRMGRQAEVQLTVIR